MSRIHFFFPLLRRKAISLVEGCEEPEVHDIISTEGELATLYFIEEEKCVSAGRHEFTRYMLRHDDCTGNSSILLPLILLN